MPYFRYTATDQTGKAVNGTLQATDDGVAMQLLQDRGFRQIRFDTSQSSTDSQAQSRFIRTKSVKDFDLMVFFTQAAQLVRAGIAPFEAFHQLAGRVRNPDLAQAAWQISQASREGGAISKTMSKYIDLFPHHTVGMVRAGEMGGFLAEALEYLAHQYSDAASFRRWFWFLKFATWQGLLGVLLALPVMPAFWEGFMAGTGTGFFVAYGRMLLFPMLPAVAGLALLGWLMRRILRSPSRILTRHRLALRVPFGLGSRARAESLRAFLWSLRNLSQAGIAPGTAWALAAGSVPNASIAVALSQAGPNRAEMPLSESFSRAGVFPHDYAAMFKTAEQTGDVVGTLDNLILYSNSEYDMRNSMVRAGIGSAGCLVILLTGGFVLVWLVYQYYGQVFDRVDEWIKR